MSIEALWAVRFVGVNGTSISEQSGGVLVLESGRLFGGDSFAYYTGNYSLASGQVTFHVDVGVHFAGGQSILGGPLVPYSLNGTATVDAAHTTMKANLVAVGQSQMRIVAILNRVAELP